MFCISAWVSRFPICKGHQFKRLTTILIDKIGKARSTRIWRDHGSKRRRSLTRVNIGSLWNDRVRPHHVVVFVFEDMAVINVGLRCGDAGRQIIFRANGRELSGICFYRVLKAALGWVRWLHRPRRERCRIDPAGDAVWAAVGFLIGLLVEWRAPDHLELDEVVVERVRVAGHVDVNPVLNCPDLRRFCFRVLEVYRVQIQEPFGWLRADLIERDVARDGWTAEVGGASGQTRWNDAWSRLRNGSSDTELHHLRQLRCWICDWARRPVT